MPVAPDTKALDPEVFDVELSPHVLTDKQVTKTIPCVGCRRACVVTTFAAPAKTQCNECRGGKTVRSPGSQAAVIPGKTQPELAVNLADCLVNKEFATATCPLCETVCELKDVCHSDHYGPRHLDGYKNGVPQYQQQIGETVMLQCPTCNTVVQLSTMHPLQMRRQNEKRQSARTGPSIYETVLGVRDETEVEVPA